MEGARPPCIQALEQSVNNTSVLFLWLRRESLCFVFIPKLKEADLANASLYAGSPSASILHNCCSAYQIPECAEDGACHVSFWEAGMLLW